jgi:hypothetical protein
MTPMLTLAALLSAVSVVASVKRMVGFGLSDYYFIYFTDNLI